MSTLTGTRSDKFHMTFFSLMEFIASKMFSKHGKRIMFISSLYVQVTQLERLKAEVVAKLNSVMGLATREEAIHFPAAISSIVWRGTGVSAVLTKELMGQNVDEQRMKEISAKVVNLCPVWMRYGEADMARDVQSLISGGREMAAAA